MSESVWRLLDRFVLRRPGFPFEWLDELRFPRSVSAACRLLASRAHQAQLQQTFEADLFPRLCEAEQCAGRDPARFRFWYRLAREVRAGRAIDASVLAAPALKDCPEAAEWLYEWQAVCADVERLAREGEAIFAAELVEKRQILRDRATDPGVQEALWLSNPAMYEVGLRYLLDHWDACRRPSKIKHIERRLYSYLQRLCAKNDTTSFFGPLNYGSFDATTTGRYQVAPEPIAARRVFFAYWAASALAARIAADPVIQPHLCPRRDPLRPGPADARGAQIYRASDGTRTIADLAAQMGLSESSVRRVVMQLVEQSVLHIDLAIPPACLDPLAFLAERVNPLSTKWSHVLTDLRRACDRFAVAAFDERRALLADLERRFSELVGESPRRGSGRMFQDRTLLYEECRGNVRELRLSASERDTIARALEPVARLSHAIAEASQSRLREHALLLFDSLSQEGRPIRLVDLLAAWRRTPPPPGRASDDNPIGQLMRLVEHHCRGRVSSLPRDEVLKLCPSPVEHALLSPDVLLAAPNGDSLAAGAFQVVLGEIHHGVQGVGWMLAFVDDPVVWEEQVRRSLPQPSAYHSPANLVFGRRMKTAPPEFPGPSILASASATSLNPDPVELNALTVERRGDRLSLRARASGPSLHFYPPSFGVPDELFAPFACFSYPLAESVSIRLGAHTPRIEIDGAVLQRERWEVPAASIPGGARQPESGFELLLHFLEFQQRLGAPDRVFVRTSAEPKPVLIDFHNFFAVELLAHLAFPVDTLTLSEMLPGPDMLWLEDDRGHYTAELRTVMVRA